MRTAIVTGAAGGIGEATALDLARWGWRVFGFDLRAGESPLLPSDLAGFGGSVEPIRVDVTDRPAVEAAVAAVLATTGGTLDAVVANAGVRVAGAFEETPFAQIRRLFEVNLGGAMHVTRAALPALRTTEGSRVVVVSSAGGLSALPGLAAYCGSKWAVEGWAESLAHELHPMGVGVAIVEPASVRTGLWDLGTVHGNPDGAYASLVEGVEARGRSSMGTGTGSSVSVSNHGGGGGGSQRPTPPGWDDSTYSVGHPGGCASGYSAPAYRSSYSPASNSLVTSES